MSESALNGMIGNLSVEVEVRLGQARPRLRELTQMEPGAIFKLDKRASDPVDLFVGDDLIGQGVLEENEEGQLCVRLVSTRAAHG